MAKQEIGRLSMRHEGNWWVAYYTLPSTMEGALELGRIHMAVITTNEILKDAFMMLMQEAVSDIIEEKTGKRPSWSGQRPAPEHERAGNA